MSIPKTKELLEQSKQDIGDIPSKAAYEGWQKLGARRAVELVEELVSLIMPLEVSDLKGIVCDADDKSRKGQEAVNKALGDDFEYDARALKNTAERIQTNTHMQGYAFGHVEDSLPGLKKLVNRLHDQLGSYDAYQRTGEEHAEGCRVGQDTFNAQVTAKLDDL